MEENAPSRAESDEESSSNSVSSESSYKMTTKVCTRLSKELSHELLLEEIICYEKTYYEPPKEPGLANANIIIPEYYHLAKDPSKIASIDYYEIIKDDIRNLRALNEYQIKYIKDLPDEYKNELLELFNRCLIVLKDIL